jgi:glycerol-3-phosphate dehydrogenase
VLYSFAGLRPLVAPGEARSEGKISRRHLVLRDPPGVLTIVGGKFTTFRKVAEDAVDALLEELGEGRRPAMTKVTPYLRSHAPATDARSDPDLWHSLEERYGPRAGSVLDLCSSDPLLAQRIIDTSPVRLGEFVYAAQYEKMRTVADFVERRTHLAWQASETEITRRLQALKPFMRGGSMDHAPLLASSGR